jgi:hypothetical protein
VPDLALLNKALRLSPWVPDLALLNKTLRLSPWVPDLVLRLPYDPLMPRFLTDDLLMFLSRTPVIC